MDRNKKPICGQSGKSFLINPNLLFGQNVGDGESVPLEDLNIYVELTTSKKSRSIIDLTEKGVTFNSSKAGKKIVSFIDGSVSGSDINGNEKKSLTTSYTELTTVFNNNSTTSNATFNQDADTEKFGITSIDINFNSSYAPLIKIEFVDIRGASLFNTGNPPNSEYSSFFDLPYPIFELTVKGYYGKPVKYCLHLTKWNARFNAQTGNFEISADFIGYTYAMLTDMLLGYLRAITKTPRGIEKFKAAKLEMNNPDELITINELLSKIADVNEAVEKLQSEDEDVRELAKNKALKTGINEVEKLVKQTIDEITEPDSSAPKGYAAFNSGDGLIGVRGTQSNQDIESIVKTFQVGINNQVTNINGTLDNSSTKLITSDFSEVKYFSDFNYNLIMSGDSKSIPINVNQLNFRSSPWELTNDEDFDEFRERITNSIGNNKSTPLTIYDFKKILDNIKEVKDNLDKKEELIKESVGIKLKGTFTETLGFEPTIRNIFRIFTVHAEIFMECLRDVSIDAESSDDRRTELFKFRNDFDINNKDTDPNGLPSKIYPWPLFREKSGLNVKNNTYEESWIGSKLTTPQNVPEVVFVEQLLEGLIKVAKEDSDRQARIDNPNTIIDSWFPVNPLDTPLFGIKQNPYKTKSIGNSTNPLDPLKLMGLRAFTFLGASNRTPRVEEARVMGALEANTCYSGIENNIIKKSLIDISDSDANITENIINIFLNGNNGSRNISLKNSVLDRPIMYQKGEDYFYKYMSSNIDGGKGQKWIPFNGNFDGGGYYKPNQIIPKTTDELLKDSFLNRPDGQVFLPSDLSNNNNDNYGGIYLKIFSENEYSSQAKALRPNYVNQVETINSLIRDLKQRDGDTKYLDSGTLHDLAITGEGDRNYIPGWNILGDETSRFAFTTLKYIDITNSENDTDKEGDNTYTFPVNSITEAELVSVFYVNMQSQFGATSLAKANKNEVVEFERPTFSRDGKEWYRLRNGGARKLDFNTDQTIDTPDLGKNRELFNQVGGSIYIPHVDFTVTNREYSNTTTVFSLFGSQLYFEQRQSSSPISARALLFLHTLPWNQLFTDDTNLFDNGWLGGIFENGERHTIANLFNRKAAFIHAPYLWCAFIGGLLWRSQTDNIIYVDGPDPITTNGQVPSYKGGSGTFDPLIWGDKITANDETSGWSSSYAPEFNNARSYWISDNTFEYGSSFPKRNQYLTDTTANTPLSLDTDGKYKNIDNVLLKLPTQIKEEFKRIFFDFVTSSEWQTIRENFEIHSTDWEQANNTVTYNNDGTNNGNWSIGTNAWKQRWNDTAFIESTTESTGESSLTWQPFTTFKRTGSTTVSGEVIRPESGGIDGIRADRAEIFENFKNLEYLIPIRSRATKYGGSGDEGISEPTFQGNSIGRSEEYNYDLAHKNSESNQIMVNLFKRGVWIANNTFKPWVVKPLDTNGDGDIDYFNDSSELGLSNEFNVPQNELRYYIQSFVSEWKRLNSLNVEEIEEDKLKQQIFNTMDTDTIRLNIYRHCKSLYDKWVADSTTDIMTSCGTSSKLVDQANILLNRKENSRHRLIDSFRFTNRAFNDLGDDYLLNPKIIHEIVTGNMNQSFYDLISRTLADNNFNFIALPAFIDYNSEVEMEALFKPEIYDNNEIDSSVSGPTFVCVYVGQGSNKLDLGEGSQFPNDGFDFICDDNGNLDMTNKGLPSDFSKPKLPHEHNVVAFAVNYGQQNQNIFTDVKLDQQEFSETDESLQITDGISKQGSQSSRTQAGQNLWNVYQVRSYSTEITAMGNAMIQPMMYFQLNNIPMFHGAYMIINTTHNIKPNFMTTTFKGVRTRYVDTPLIDSDTLYMSMLGTLTDVDGLASFDSNAFKDTVGLASDVLPIDPSQVSSLGFSSVYPDGINFTVVSGVGPRNAQAGASKFHPGIDMAPKDESTGVFLAPNGDTSIIWNNDFDYSTVDKDYKGRPKVNIPVLAGANATVFGLRISPTVGIILDLIIDNTYDDRGYVMRYMHLLDVSDKIVEAAAKVSGSFTLEDWKSNNVSGDLRVVIDVKVQQGEIIGLTGGQKRLRKFGSTDSAGPASSGPHLHLELLEFEGENFDRSKIKTCVSCRKSDYSNRGLTANLKDYKAFLSDGSEPVYESKQRTQDTEEGDAT